MALDATGRARMLAQMMREGLDFSGLVKADIAAAIGAVDDWIDANATSYNQALPQPFRGTASAPMKTLLLCFVAMRRAGRYRAQEDN